MFELHARSAEITRAVFGAPLIFCEYEQLESPKEVQATHAVVTAGSLYGLDFKLLYATAAASTPHVSTENFLQAGAADLRGELEPNKTQIGVKIDEKEFTSTPEIVDYLMTIFLFVVLTVPADDICSPLVKDSYYQTMYRSYKCCLLWNTARIVSVLLIKADVAKGLFLTPPRFIDVGINAITCDIGFLDVESVLCLNCFYHNCAPLQFQLRGALEDVYPTIAKYNSQQTLDLVIINVSGEGVEESSRAAYAFLRPAARLVGFLGSDEECAALEQVFRSHTKFFLECVTGCSLLVVGDRFAEPIPALQSVQPLTVMRAKPAAEKKESQRDQGWLGRQDPFDGVKEVEGLFVQEEGAAAKAASLVAGIQQRMRRGIAIMKPEKVVYNSAIAMAKK